jgi:hypothetical protein
MHATLKLAPKIPSTSSRHELPQMSLQTMNRKCQRNGEDFQQTEVIEGD